MSNQILSAMQATEVNLRKISSSKPSTPKGGLLSRSREKDTSKINTIDNISSYVKQIREARTNNA